MATASRGRNGYDRSARASDQRLSSRQSLSAFSHYGPTTTPLGVNHQGQFAAATISFNLPVGVSLSDATSAVDDAMAQIGVPIGVHGSFQGTARAFQASLKSQPLLILAALLAVYIVLGMLYESVDILLFLLEFILIFADLILQYFLNSLACFG